MGGQSKNVTRSILLNGRPQSVAAETLDGLLDELGQTPGRRGIALALNGEVVPRGRWVETVLSEGDSVEIVGAVQGG